MRSFNQSTRRSSGFFAVVAVSCGLQLTTMVQAFSVPPIHTVSNERKSSATTTRILALTSSASTDCGAYEEHPDSSSVASRRGFLTRATTTAATLLTGASLLESMVAAPQSAHAVGPVKVALNPTSYYAEPCPPNKPIPGEKAMVGMRPMCVTVKADLKEAPPKELEKVGVYGFVTDGVTGDSVLANNPDLSTDAGQFAMVESVTPADKTVTFEFIAAVPRDFDTSQFSNGIGKLDFSSLRIISFPGGQQFGEISPCEMNEFSEECEAWEAENGPYEKGEFMVKSNARTKGR